MNSKKNLNDKRYEQVRELIVKKHLTVKEACKKARLHQSLYYSRAAAPRKSIHVQHVTLDAPRSNERAIALLERVVTLIEKTI